jgi:hypothetical protein
VSVARQPWLGGGTPAISAIFLEIFYEVIKIGNRLKFPLHVFDITNIEGKIIT